MNVRAILNSMSLQLNPELQKFVDEQIKEGRYDSASEVVEAGLAILEQQTRSGEFAPGALDRLLAEAEADVAQGKFHDGEEVFRQLDEMSAARRRAQK